MNVEHIGVYAQDSAVLADWYAKVLQLDEVRRIEKEGRPPVVFLSGETGAVVEILPTDAGPVERDLKTPGFTHLGIVVADLNAQQSRLAGLGVEMWDIRSTSNGWKIGYFHDPEGNTLEFIQR
jgi:catechol 2,3-dioxygenase-like lactoylglutathione lyase family enzyme